MKARAVFLCAVLICLQVFTGPARALPPDTVTVLTYNVFDPFFGPKRGERINELADAIMSLAPVPDVMVFQEFFRQKDRETLVRDLLDAGYPLETIHYHDNAGYGSGMFMLSRFELDFETYTPYPVDGDWFDPEKYSGKGILLYRLDTPYGLLKVFATHPISRFKPLYNKDGTHNDRDRRTVDRLLEMEYLSGFVQKEMSPKPVPGEDWYLPPTRSFVLCGDMNASPDMWSYQYLRARTGAADSFAELHPASKAGTYSPENTMVSGSDFGRIDHILYKNIRGESGFWIRPQKSEVVFKGPVELSSGEVSHLSDHFGVMTVFEVVREREEVELGPSFWPPKSDEAPLPSDLTEDGIRLTAKNHLAWQNWAIEVMSKANRGHNRYEAAVIPSARTVLPREITRPVVIPLTSMERLAVRARLLKEDRKQ